MAVLLSLNDLPGFRGVEIATERQDAASMVIDVIEARLAGELRRLLEPTAVVEVHLTTDVTPAGFLELRQTPVSAVGSVHYGLQRDPPYASEGEWPVLGQSFWRWSRDGLHFAQPMSWGTTYPNDIRIAYTGGLDSSDPIVLAQLRSCALPAAVRLLGAVDDGLLSADQVSDGALSVVKTQTRSPWSAFTAEEWAGVAMLARP